MTTSVSRRLNIFYWWSHGSWMDNYLCNQWPSPQKVWVRILRMQHVLDVILYHNSQWFSPASPVSSTNKIDSHDIVEILLKVALNTITLTHIRTNNIYFRTSSIWKRTARSYPYGSEIYIYICTHCHSLFRLWVRFSHMVILKLSNDEVFINHRFPILTG
jgi:hypothetical protein